MAKPALLMTGPMMPLIARGCEDAFIVHRLWEASDREALLRQVAPADPRHLHRRPHRRENR